MKKIQTPVKLKVWGKVREVVDIDIKGRRWTERLPDGALVHHLGKLIPTQEPGRLLDEPKLCKHCKTPAITATALGRAYHPDCEAVNVIPDDMAMRIVYGVARDLGAEIIEVRDA